VSAREPTPTGWSIFDELATPAPQTFEYWLHAEEPFEIGGQHDIRLEMPTAGCQIDMLEPEGLIVDQTDQFDPPPRERIQLSQWHLTASTTEATREQHFATVIRPHRAGEEQPTGASIERTDNCHAVRAETADGEVIALWRTGPGELSAMGVTSDGDVAAVKLDADGIAVEGFVFGGEMLDYEGELVPH